MPLALVALAWLLLMTGINGNYTAVGNQFESDVLNNGQGGGFLQFMAGIIGIAVFFRVIGLPNVGRVFLILVLLVFILQNENVLTQLQSFGTTATGTGTTSSTGSTATASTSSTLLPATSSLSSPTIGGNAQAAVGGTLTGETSGTGSST